jgi:hypothetical protein
MSLFQQHSFSAILFCTILALIIVMIISFFVENAKKKMGLNLIYLLVGGIFIGLPALRSGALDHPFYFYLVLMIWNLIAGTLHWFLSKKLLGWPGTEPFGWRLLFALAIILIGFGFLLTFMKVEPYTEFDAVMLYNWSAMLTFFIPVTMAFSYECYLMIPPKIFLPKKPWIYNRAEPIVFREVSHFFIFKYHLTINQGGELIESLPMRAQGTTKLGDYFNATLECAKVTHQGHYNIQVRDQSNNYLGWYFFLSDGKSAGKLLDPNKTFLDLGFTTQVFFGNSSIQEAEEITTQADREGKAYLIICKREDEYKSQLMTNP